MSLLVFLCRVFFPILRFHFPVCILYRLHEGMYCPNCGTLSIGYQREGLTEFECGRCLTMFVRSYKNRRQDLLLITIPKGTVRLT